MAKALLVAGFPTGTTQDNNTTRFGHAMGSLDNWGNGGSTENDAEVTARNAWTFADLLFQVSSNSMTGTSTVTFRVAAADGNQTVSILTTQTGKFEDTANSDDVTSGQTFNVEITTLGSHGNVLAYIMSSYTMEDATDDAQIILAPRLGSAGVEGFKFNQATTFHCSIGGLLREPDSTAEADANFLIRFGATFRNFGLFVKDNNVDNSSTFILRVNDADGNLSISVGAGASGLFEDTTNTDVISSGNTLSNRAIIGAGMSTDDIHVTGWWYEYDSTSRIMMITDRGFNDSELSFYPLESGGLFAGTGTEANAHVDTRVAFDAANYLIRVETNSLDATATVDFRIDGVSSALGVSIGATATGDFEDTTSTVSVVVTDEINHLADGTAATTGSLHFSFISIEQQEEEQPMPLYDSLTPAIQRRVVVRAY